MIRSENGEHVITRLRHKSLEFNDTFYNSSDPRSDYIVLEQYIVFSAPPTANLKWKA